jgi:hypothetical protein
MNVAPTYAWIKPTNWGDYAQDYPLILQPDKGYVGIGTKAPAALLHAQRTQGNAAIYADYNGTNIVRVEAAANGNGYIGIASGAGTLSIGTAGAADLLFLRTNGTVSIGTTTDRGGLLQVEGMTRASAFKYIPAVSPHGIAGDLFLHHTQLRMFNGTALYKVENTEDGGSSWTDVTSSGINSFKFVFNRQPRAARYGGFSVSPKSSNHIGGGRRFTFAVGYSSWMGWVHSGSANGTTIRLRIEALGYDESYKYDLLNITYSGYPDDHTFPFDQGLDSGVGRIRVSYVILSQAGIPGQPDNNAGVGCGVMLSTYNGQWINNEIDDRDGAMVVANRLAFSDYADKRVDDVGIGVSFPSTQRASPDVNTLDDYEEGTWTAVMPTESGTDYTITSQTCRYTKIGNVVTVNATITYSAQGNGSITRVTLPFMPAQTPMAICFAGVITGTSSVNNLTEVSLIPYTGNELLVRVSAVDTQYWTPRSSWASAGALTFNGSYVVS